LTYIWPPTLTKLSILVLYWRISPNKVFRGFVIATAVVLIGYTVTFTVLFSGPCNPLLGTPESAVCLNNIAISQAVLNIITDGVLIALPIPTIHALHMPLKQRITVGGILALGSAYVTPPTNPSLAVRANPESARPALASIIRVAYVRAMVDNPDVTFTQCSAAVWSLLEMNLGILCNSLAALKPFVRRHLPSLFSKTGSGAGTGGKTDESYAKRSKGSRGWGHSYQLHSVGNGKTETAADAKKEGRKDIVVVDQFSVEYGRRNGEGSVTTGAAPGKGDSTDSILAPQYPAHQAV
jgi:hypothetical protein